MLGRPLPEWTDKCARATASRSMGAVKEASWATQSGVMECGYHDRQGNGNCRCPTQEESRHSVCTGGKMERIESEKYGPWLQTFLSWRHEQ